jgi:hypothetical protein
LPQSEWNDFRADFGGGCECRVPMLLLAAAAGYPSVAREWFEAQGMHADEALAEDAQMRVTQLPEWSEFVEALETIRAQKDGSDFISSLESARLWKWLLRVERFAF